MDDLLTSYISQMLTAMSKQRSAKGSKWTARSHWQVAMGLIHQLRPVGYPCSWGTTFASQMWKMSRTPSGSSLDSDLEGSNPTSPSSEDDYLWRPILLAHPAPQLRLTPRRFPGDTTALRQWLSKDALARGLPEPNGWHHKSSWKRICVCVCVCVACFVLFCFS